MYRMNRCWFFHFGRSPPSVASSVRAVPNLPNTNVQMGSGIGGGGGGGGGCGGGCGGG